MLEIGREYILETTGRTISGVIEEIRDGFVRLDTGEIVALAHIVIARPREPLCDFPPEE